MKIISKFKDYYDGGAVYGVDEKSVYVRETKIVELSNLKIRCNKFEIVGFCGEIYLAKFNRWRRKKLRDGGHEYCEFDPKKDSYWCEESLKWDIDERNGEFLLKKDDALSLRFFNEDDVYNDLLNSKELKDLFKKHATPIFHIPYIYSDPFYKRDPYYKTSRWGNNVKVVINPCLKNIGFQTIKDTVQTFQEIYMYLNSVKEAGAKSESTAGNNEVVGNSKGFDRWSFRKQGGKSKKPKKF